MIKLVPVRDEHLVFLSDNLRKQDLIEINCSHPNGNVLDLIRTSVSVSDEVMVALKDETPIAVFGVSKLPVGGCPWLLGTDELAKHPKMVVSISKPMVERWLKTYGFLTNFVHIDNKISIRWLTSLGFKIENSLLKRCTRNCACSGDNECAIP
jgi:hypothetical protein